MITLKVMLHPNNKQTTRLFQFAGAARFAYNWAINQQKANYQAGNKFIPESALRKQFTQFKRQPGQEWMYTISNDVFKQSLRDCCQAYQRLFKHQSKHPRYKSKKRGNFSFYQDTLKIQFTATHVRIEMLGGKRKQLCWVKLAESNRIPTQQHSYYNPRITYDGLHWWVSVAVDTPARTPIITYTDPIGVDLGVKELAVCSDGAVYHNINKTPKVRKLKKKQRRLQRQVSRKYQMNRAGQKFVKTSNIRKQEHQLRKIYQRLKNIRQSYMLQVIHQIVQRHPSCIVLEDLNVSGMMKNRHLAAAIQEQTFYRFRATLECYTRRMGIPVKYTDRWYPSSKRCSNCGHLKVDLKLSDRVYKCSNCGLELDRDLNAAINLKQLA